MLQLAQSIGLLTNADAESRALSDNDFGEAVGWSGTSEWNGTGTATTSKAFVSRGIGVYAPVSLNDKHFVHGLTGWDLAVAHGINNAGWVVGVGTKNGQTRGFLLRKLANQSPLRLNENDRQIGLGDPWPGHDDSN